MKLSFLFPSKGMNTEKIVFLIWEQRFGIASIVQLGKLRLATHSNIRLRTNIAKKLNKKRTTYIITNYIYIYIFF